MGAYWLFQTRGALRSLRGASRCRWTVRWLRSWCAASTARTARSAASGTLWKSPPKPARTSKTPRNVQNIYHNQKPDLMTAIQFSTTVLCGYRETGYRKNFSRVLLTYFFSTIKTFFSNWN